MYYQAYLLKIIVSCVLLGSVFDLILLSFKGAFFWEFHSESASEENMT